VKFKISKDVSMGTPFLKRTERVRENRHISIFFSKSPIKYIFSLNLSHFVYLANQPAGQPPFWTIVPYFVFIFAIFYFLIIRPQKKREKDHKAFTEGLQKNQAVVTTGGLHGTIVNVKETTVMIRIADNVRVEIDKGSVTRSVKAAS